jgi:hypothetical protein
VGKVHDPGDALWLEAGGAALQGSVCPLKFHTSAAA